MSLAPPAVPPPSTVAVPHPIISGFGEWHGAGGGPRLWQHAGIDIRAPIGTPVLAAADGAVAHVGQQVLAGKLIVVAHADDLATVYFHLSEIDVAAGQLVRRGQVIGRSGNTGNATTPHLHFGVCRHQAGRCGERIDDGWDDPARYWVSGSPCFAPGQASSSQEARRLTYPLLCAG